MVQILADAHLLPLKRFLPPHSSHLELYTLDYLISYRFKQLREPQCKEIYQGACNRQLDMAPSGLYLLVFTAL